MGKLYDKQDMEFDVAQIDKLEQENSAQIANGTFPALKARLAADLFEKSRMRCKMTMLRSFQLLADLRGALALFKKCPHCVEASGKQKPCNAHRDIVQGAKKAVFWAGEENLARRATLGISLADDEPTPGADEPANPLNEWETWYYSDRRNGVWPGDAAYAVAQYGSADYRGWLQMLLEEEEIPLEAFHTEQERLRGAHT